MLYRTKQVFSYLYINDINSISLSSYKITINSFKEYMMLIKWRGFNEGFYSLYFD